MLPLHRSNGSITSTIGIKKGVPFQETPLDKDEDGTQCENTVFVRFYLINIIFFVATKLPASMR